MMFSQFPPIYIIPPLLSFVVGISLAIVAIAKGKFKTENILFALVCIWWTLMPPVFISHHILTDEAKIISFERIIHCFYVFLPVIHLLFIHRILNIQRRWLVIVSFLLSALLSASTFTHYYIEGLYKYSWGYIAKGGIAFQVFGVYGFIILLYMLFCLIANLKNETNNVKRLSNSYIIMSFVVMGILTILNLPAINGTDLYPAGNFSFIPLAVLGYGVLRYHMLDIKSFLHITVVRVFSVILLMVPNWVIFYYARPYFSKMDNMLLFVIFSIWFLANYLYLTRVQTKIDDKFYRIKYRLKLSEIAFGEAVRAMNDPNMLVEKIRQTLKEALDFSSVTIFKRMDPTHPLIGPLGYQIPFDNVSESLLFNRDPFVDRSMLEGDPQYATVGEKVLKTFTSLKSVYMVPLFRDEKIIALYFLSGSSYVKITKDEIDFTKNILTAVSVKLAKLERTAEQK